MTMRASITTVLASCALLIFSDVHAQTSRFSLEARVGAAMPRGHLEGVFADRGHSLAADLMFDLTRHLSLYGGVSRENFGCVGSCDGPTSEGFQAGLGIRLVPSWPVIPFVRGGVLRHQLETEDESEMSFGYEVGGGFEVPVSQRISIVPSGRYRRYEVDWPNEFGMTARWYTAGLGARIKF